MNTNSPHHVARSLYRALLRQARAIDSSKDPRLRFLVVGKPSSAYDRSSRSTISFHCDAFSEKLYRFTGGQYYRTSEPKITLEEIIREAFQGVKTADGDEQSFAQLQEAFQALRYFADVLDLRSELQTSDTQLPEPSVDEPPGGRLQMLTDYLAIENFSGKLLVTHPVSCIDQREFHRAVCVLSDEISSVTGYILNKPLPKKSKQKLVDVLRHPLASRLNDFGLWNGGPIPCLTLVLDTPVIKDSLEIAPGMFVYQLVKKPEEVEKTLDQIVELLDEGKLAASSIKVIYGCCGWDRQQLLSELERGTWFLTDNPGDVTLDDSADTMWRNYLTRFGGEYREFVKYPDFSTSMIKKLSVLQKEAFVQAMEDERKFQEERG